jgi:hypothetical protein
MSQLEVIGVVLAVIPAILDTAKTHGHSNSDFYKFSQGLGNFRDTVEAFVVPAVEHKDFLGAIWHNPGKPDLSFMKMVEDWLREIYADDFVACIRLMNEVCLIIDEFSNFVVRWLLLMLSHKLNTLIGRQVCQTTPPMASMGGKGFGEETKPLNR